MYVSALNKYVSLTTVSTEIAIETSDNATTDNPIQLLK